MLIKLCGKDIDGKNVIVRLECTGTNKSRIQGNHDMKSVSTNYVECQNLTMRMSMRRLTNTFSKKQENYILAVALYFTYYNFARSHKILVNP